MSTSSDNASDPAAAAAQAHAHRPYDGRISHAECEALQARRRRGSSVAYPGG